MQTDLDKQMEAVKHMRDIAKSYYPEHVKPLEDVYYKISGVRLPGSYQEASNEKIKEAKR